MNPNKVSAVQSWPVPKTLKDVRAFLSFTGYYRRFIHNYAHITHPLTDLMQKDAFAWSPSVLEAFTALQTALTTAPLLRLPDFSKSFVIETNASGIAIGAVLLQDE